MASLIKVDEIQNSAGTPLLINGYPRRPGQIIEYLSSPCDGSTITGASGSYTVQNVTTQQVLTDAYADVTGSSITYAPPTGATEVRYIFHCNHYWPSGTHCIGHFKFFIDGVEVVYARHTRAAQYPEGRYSFEWTIAIGGVANPNTGRQSSWTAPKTLKMQARRYAAANPLALHGTTYWDGASSNQFGMPIISIIAIA